MFVINGYDRKANACSPCTFCFLIDLRHKCLKDAIDLLFYVEHLWVFGKCLLGIAKKKPLQNLHNRHLTQAFLKNQKT